MKRLVLVLVLLGVVGLSLSFRGMCPYSEGDDILAGKGIVASFSGGVLENLALEKNMFDSLLSIEYTLNRKKFIPESFRLDGNSYIVEGKAGDLEAKIAYTLGEKELDVDITFKSSGKDEVRIMFRPCDFEPLVIRGKSFHFIQGRHVAYGIDFPGSLSMYIGGMFVIVKRGAKVENGDAHFKFRILVDEDIETIRRRLGLSEDTEIVRKVVDEGGNPITGLPVVLKLDGRYVSADIPDENGIVRFGVSGENPSFEILGEDVDVKDDRKVLRTSFPSKVSFRWQPYVTGVFEDVAHVALRLTRPGTAIVVLNGEKYSDDLVDTFHMVEIDSLKPATFYKAVVETLGGTKEVVFKTLGGKNFEFAIYGDTRTNETWHEMVCNSIAKENILFLIHTGDLVESGDLMVDWDKFFHACRNLYSKVPLVPSLGNHERNSPIYYQAFYLPKGGGDFQKRWYSLDVDYIHITVLDSTIPRGSKLDKDQIEWLEEDLKKAKDKFKIVVFHYPFFTNSPNREPNHREDWQRLFEKYGVKLVLNGHMHHYERFLINGVMYVTTGGGGAPLGFGLKSPERKHLKGTMAGAAGYLHYVLAKVYDDRIEFTVKAVAKYDWGVLEKVDEVIDSFTIRR